jgi:hypothetical protein
MSQLCLQLRRDRQPQLFAMHPADFEQAVMLVRRAQLELIRQANQKNRHCARVEDRSACTAGLLLGSLIVALGFEPLKLDSDEEEAGVGPDQCRRYIGIAA